jgi:hypothetical protein
MLHPAVVMAVLVLLVNDHVLKVSFPGWWTGKISDFAGLIFFPLLLQAIWEIGVWCVGVIPKKTGTVCWVAVLATGMVFTAVQVWPTASAIYRIVWGRLGWMVNAVIATVLVRPVPLMTEAKLVADPTDLIALLVLGIPMWIEKRKHPYHG